MMKLGFNLGVALFADAVLDTGEEPVVRPSRVILGHPLEEVKVPFHQGGAFQLPEKHFKFCRRR